jgi:ADP-heptose:LPS heptosyltransferase
MKKIILVSWGHIGDAIVCTPMLRALKESNPNSKIILYAHRRDHLLVFKNNPHIDSLRYLSVYWMWRYPYHLFAYLFNKKLVQYFPLRYQRIHIYEHIYNKRNVKMIAGDIFNLSLANTNVQLFLTLKEERKAREKLAPFKNVVLMHIHSRSSVNHHWNIEHWNELVKQLPQCTFIQIGHLDEPCVEGAQDWRGQTSLREAFSLLKYASSFVGVDSGIAHATNAFGIPGVVLFGDSSPVYWGHDNNINIYKNVACSPCYYHLLSAKCPYNHECMETITVREVKEALVSQLKLRSESFAS